MSEDKVSVPDATPTELGEKQGRNYCFCCDMRRAVILLAIFALIQNAILTFGALTGSITINVDNNNVEGGTTNVDEPIAPLWAIGYIFLCLMYIFQIVAAVKYNVCMLATVAVVDIIGFIYTLLAAMNASSKAVEYAWAVLGFIAYLIFFSPVVLLIREIQTGIMSEATYPRESHSCCHNPPTTSRPRV